MKEKIIDWISQNNQRLLEISDFIFDHPELGLAEYQASDRLCEYLSQNGFCVEKGVGGIETAFRAVYQNKEGGPSIGLLCEYDALERLGHACGHHTQGPAILGAANAIKAVVKDLPYKLVVYGTPAEETVGGKIIMLNNGCFDDIDVALMMHLSPETCVDIKSLALTKFKVTFTGVSAHAAIKPDAGRSALDALLLSFNGLEFMREHVKDDTRIHYTVVDAGGAANSVPAKAIGSFYVRSYNRAYLDDVIRRFKNVMQGAALMTETTVDIVEEKVVDSKIPVLTLNDVLMKNAELCNAPGIDPPREKTGSTDFGNVMYRLPGSCIRIAFVPKGTSSHSQAYVDAGKADAAHNGVDLGAKILACSVLDLIEDKPLFEKIQEEFKTNKKAATVF